MPSTPRRSTSSTNNSNRTTAAAKTPQAHVAAASKLVSNKSSSVTPTTTSSSSSSSKLNTGAKKQFSSNFDSKSSLAKLEQQLSSLETNIESRTGGGGSMNKINLNEEEENVLLSASVAGSPSHNDQEDHNNNSTSSDEITAITNANNNDEGKITRENLEKLQQRAQTEEPNHRSSNNTTPTVPKFALNSTSSNNNKNQKMQQQSTITKPSTAPSSKQQQQQQQHPNTSRTPSANNTPNGKVGSQLMARTGVPAPPTSSAASARGGPNGGGRFQRSRDLAVSKAQMMKRDQLQQQQRTTSPSSKNNTTAHQQENQQQVLVNTVSFSPRSSSSRNAAGNTAGAPTNSTSTLTKTPSFKRTATPSDEVSVSNNNSSSSPDPLARFDRLARSVQCRQSVNNNNNTSSSPNKNNNNNNNSKISQTTKYTEDTYPWPKEVTSEDSIVLDCKVKGAMEKQGSGCYVYSFPETGFFACRRCHKRFSNVSNKIAAEGGYASFEKYQVSNLRCDLVIPCASLSKQMREIKEKYPGKVSFIADATIAVSCNGCLANVGVLHPVKGHLMTSSCAIVHCEVDKLHGTGNSINDHLLQEQQQEDSIFAEVLAAHERRPRKNQSSTNSTTGRGESRLSCRTTGSILVGGIEIEQNIIDDGYNSGSADDYDEDELDTDDEFPEATAATVLFP